jgi:hypothetical protein
MGCEPKGRSLVKLELSNLISKNSGIEKPVASELITKKFNRPEDL